MLFVQMGASWANPTTPDAGGGGAVAPAKAGEPMLGVIESAVRADAVRRWQLADGTSLSLEVEEVTWSDGALGCPQPGRLYTQAIIPGWRIVVRDAARSLVYHAGRRGQWLACDRPVPATPIKPAS